MNYSSHIFFLKECVRLHLTPSFVQCNVKCCFPFLKTKIEKWIRDKWIRAEIRRWHGLKNSTSKLLYYAHSRLSSLLHPDDLDRFLGFCNHKAGIRRRNIKSTKLKKLNMMIHQQNGYPEDDAPAHKFYSRFINESGVALSGEEEELLSRGLKYSIPPLSTNGLKETIMSNVISVTPSYPRNVEERISNVVHNAPVTVAPKSLRNTVLTLKKKFKEENTIITRSDKGRDRGDYE